MNRVLTRCTAIIWVFICLGCTSPEQTHEKHLKTIVAKYNNALTQAYSSRFLSSLSEVASEKEVNKVEVIIASFFQGNTLMESELHRMDFHDVNIEGDKATVRTSEDWSYRWVDFRTSEEIEPLKDIHYEMLYHLIKKDDKWLVDSVEDVGETRE